MSKSLYIAYADTLNRRLMKLYCQTAKPFAKSWLFGYKLVFQPSARGVCANVVEDSEHDVPVIIWELEEEDKKALADYMTNANKLYRREIYLVEVDGEIKEAFTYAMPPGGHGIPADSYLQAIAQGYAQFNFPVDELNHALISAYEYAENTKQVN